ncbi:Serine/threonine-protein kinase Nek9 [Hondaea fermentalgiana]|uniref:Serine/threonine-protein kinase Nek9 n=1 Tax=Hondaea fermentalgiana TaxID=2315210 RepID=A0A2R5GUN7_9STRA|nr:Serine/threonine-protein kinase Nek9 [Hondaea fermentalgiana]|eukprot:GBG34586.1 Serine/threonine-protein kinase Nek9 [Hondaea fermentalgiana]
MSAEQSAEGATMTTTATATATMEAETATSGAREEVVRLVRVGRAKEAVENALRGMPLETSSLGLVCALLVLQRSLALDADANESLASYESLVETVSDALRAEKKRVPLAQTRRGGRLVSFGRCDLQLGYATADSVAIQVLPRRIDLDVRITKLSTALHHTVAVDQHGRIWTWGHGQHGRLGLGDEKTRIEPNLVREMASHVVTRVATGKDHTLAVTSHGNLYAWGSNEKGQLGTGSGRGSAQPRRVRLPAEEAKTSAVGSVDSDLNERSRPSVRLIAASATHSVAIDNLGRAYAWGANDKCQLGVRDTLTSRVTSPRLMTAGVRLASSGIIQACAAEGVTYLLSKSGDVLQIGLGLHAPTKVRLRLRSGDGDDDEHADWSYGGRGGESGVRVSHLACGPSHAAAVTTEGMLFTWGTHASLLGHAGKGCDRNNEQAHTTKPSRVTALRRQRIVSVSCSRNHTCALDHRGNMYTWGNGERGALGSSQTYQPTPTRVTTLRGICAAAAADTHTIALVQTREPKFDEIPLAAAFGVEGVEGSWPGVSLLGEESEQNLGSDETSPLDDLAEPISGDYPDDESDSEGESDHDGHAVVHQPMSLQLTCERVMAESVNLWNVVSTWEFADRLYAVSLANFCKRFVALNLDVVLTMGNTLKVEERIARLCAEPLFDIDQVLAVETCQDPAQEQAGAASPAHVTDFARMRSQSVVSAFSTASDLEDRGMRCQFSPMGPGVGAAACPPATTAKVDLSSLSLPRLRKRLEACERQRLGTEDMQLKLMASTPDRRKPQAKRARALDEQMADILASMQLIEHEITLRLASSKTCAAPQDDSDNLYWCRTCDVRVNSENAMVHHVSGKKHRRNQAKEQERIKLDAQKEKSRGHALAAQPSSDGPTHRRDASNPWQSPQVDRGAGAHPVRHETEPRRRSGSVAAGASLRDIQQEEESRKLFQEQRRRYLQSQGMLPATPQQGTWSKQVSGAAPPSMSLTDSPLASAYLSPLTSRQRSGSMLATPGGSAGASGGGSARSLQLGESSVTSSSPRVPTYVAASPETKDASGPPPRGVSLSDYLTPKTKSNRASAAPWAQQARAKSSSRKDKSVSGSQGTVLRAMQQSLDLQSIQMEQQEESVTGRNRCDLQVSSWGMHTRNGEQTLSDIQSQQALEMESERLAMELAAQEGLQQDAIFSRSQQQQNQEQQQQQQLQQSSKSRKSRPRRSGGSKKKSSQSTSSTSTPTPTSTSSGGEGPSNAGPKRNAKAKSRSSQPHGRHERRKTAKGATAASSRQPQSVTV